MFPIDITSLVNDDFRAYDSGRALTSAEQPPRDLTECLTGLLRGNFRAQGSIYLRALKLLLAHK